MCKSSTFIISLASGSRADGSLFPSLRKYPPVSGNLMKNFNSYILIIFALISCKENTSHSQKESKKISSNSYFSKKPINYYYDFDTSKSYIENFDSGFVDTFSVNNVKFKYFSNPDSSNDIEMQFFSESKWQTNFKTFFGFYGNDHETDINNDGFNDFRQNLPKGSYVFLFNKGINKFSEIPMNIALEYEMIDTFSNTYFQIWKQNEPEWTSDLFRFHELNQYFLYTLKCIDSKKTMHSASAIRLYKCKNGKISDTTFITQIKIDKDFYEFNYKEFWKKIIKKEKATANKRFGVMSAD